MASRNGLNPKIKAPKGIGFGRALPAPFGFGNGISASSGKLSIPSFMNGIFVQQPPFTIEFWTKCNVGTSDGQYWIWFYLSRIAPPTYDQTFDANSGLGLHTTDNGYRGGVNINFDGSRQHCVWIVDEFGYCNAYFNGIYRNTFLGQTSIYYPDNVYLNFSGHFQAIDEFRYYSKALRKDEVELNYNGGIGNNPCDTEHLTVWYQFKEFENLDFSAGQDGSDIRLGIRDMSNKNNHGLPLDMDTSPTSSTYVLQAF